LSGGSSAVVVVAAVAARHSPTRPSDRREVSGRTRKFGRTTTTTSVRFPTYFLRPTTYVHSSRRTRRGDDDDDDGRKRTGT